MSIKSQPRVAIFLLFLGLSAAAPAAAGAQTGTETTAPSATELRGRAYARLMRSMLLARQGEVAEAVEEVRKATEDAPQSADLLAEAAQLLVRWTGNAEQSMRLARRAREIDPHHRAATRFLAEMAAARALGPEHSESARDEAIALYHELAENHDAERHEALQTLVQLKLQAGDMAGALESVRQLVRERPGDVRATQTLAQLLLHSDRKTEALEVLLDYVVGHPQEEEVLGWAEQLAGSQQAWPTVVDFLLARQPFEAGSALVQRFLGEALLRLERVTEAAPLLEQALEERPDDARLRKDVALAYRGLGRMADAAALFEELARESPEYPFLQQLLAETLAEQRDVDGALEAYRGALHALEERSDVDPVHRDAIRQRIALLHLGRKDYAAVREDLSGLEGDPGALALEIRCRVALDTGAWDEARRLARELGDTNRGRALMLEGESYAGQRKWSKAAERFADAIEALGPYARVGIAEIYRERGKPEEGLRLLRAWLLAEPESADAHFHIGVYAYELEHLEEAERELREAFRLDPRHARALNFLGYSLAERKMRLDEALGMIERALEVDAWNGAYLDSLGWVYYQMGRYEDARSPLERAARELPGDPTVLEHLGDLYHSLGNAEGARTAWNRALAAAPEAPETVRLKIERETSTGAVAGEGTAASHDPSRR